MLFGFLFRWWVNALLDGNKFVLTVTTVIAVALTAGSFQHALSTGDPAAMGIVIFVVVVAVILVVLAIVDRRLNPSERKRKAKGKPEAKGKPKAKQVAPSPAPEPRPMRKTRPVRPADPPVEPSTLTAKPPAGARMAARLAAEATITVGEACTLAGPSPEAPYEVVFEDDGATGYLYGLDRGRAGNPIVDALHIYDVGRVADRVRPSQVQLVWSQDGLKAALLINKQAHAILDFAGRRGYCRTGFPPPDPSWSSFDHAWDDDTLDLFRRPTPARSQ